MPTDPRVSETCCEAKRADRGRVFRGGHARLGPCCAGPDIDHDGFQVAQIDDDPPVDTAVPRAAVPSAPYRERAFPLAREEDRARDVSGIGRTDNGRGPPIQAAHEEGPRLVVVGALGSNQASAQARAERGKLAGRRGCNVHT